MASESARLSSNIQLIQYFKTTKFLTYENDLHSFAKETFEEETVLNVLTIFKQFNSQYTWQEVLFEMEKQNHESHEYVLSLKPSNIWHELYRVTEGMAYFHRKVPRYWENAIKCKSSNLMIVNPKIMSPTFFQTVV